MKKDILYDGLTEERSSMAILLGILCLICGLIGLTASYVGIIFLIPCVGMMSYYKGVKINTETNTIQYYYSIFGFKDMSSEQLQDGYKYIVCRKHIETIVTESRRWSPGVSKKIVFIVLLVNESTRFNKLLYKSDSKKTAKIKGIEISKILGLELKEL